MDEDDDDDNTVSHQYVTLLTENFFTNRRTKKIYPIKNN